MDELLKQIGKRIYDRRKQLRLTQDELAEQANIMSQTISAAELGKKALRPENIIGVSRALNISTDYLLQGIITTEDKLLLLKDVPDLSPAQFRHLEDIIISYIAALREKEV